MSDSAITNLPAVQSKALELIHQGKPLGQVLGLLRPAISAAPEDVKPEVPEKFAFTESHKSALAIVQSIVERAVEETPTERRAMTDDEIEALLKEAVVLDTIASFIKKRQEAHRVAVYNHFDVELENIGPTDGLLKDAKLHYVTADSVTIPGQPIKFTRETREAAASLTAAALETQIGVKVGDDVFTRDDYLAATTAQRFLDEPKMTLAMRRKPALMVEVLQRATMPGTPSSSFFKRKA